MSREIKFRGMRIEDKKWFYGTVVFDEQKDPFIVGNVLESNEEYISLEFWQPIIPKTLGQFTGLKDKNGKEIYEGDIVVNNNGGSYHCREMIVCWHDYHAGWSLATKIENIGHWAIKAGGHYTSSEIPYVPPLAQVNTHYEIIGNIYENPELLK